MLQGTRSACSEMLTWQFGNLVWERCLDYRGFGVPNSSVLIVLGMCGTHLFVFGHHIASPTAHCVAVLQKQACKLPLTRVPTAPTTKQSNV